MAHGPERQASERVWTCSPSSTVSAESVLKLYRWIFAILIMVASAQTLMFAGEVHRHVALLAAIEIVGALLLMGRRTQWVGACVLFIVFACAQVMSALQGEWATRFLQFSASVFIIVMLDRALMSVRR